MTAISTRSVQQLSPDESDAAEQWRKLLGGLAGRIEPVPVGIMYRLGLLLVAATRIVLLIVYLALIVLAGYATITAAAQRKRAAELVLNEVLADAMLRMEIALSLEPTEESAKPQAAEPADEYDLADAPAAGSKDLLGDALTAVRSCAPTVESLRQNFYLLGTLGPRLRPENNAEHLVEELLARSKHVT